MRRFGLAHGGESKAEIRRRKKTSYGLRLEEKQKIKFIYGISEKQFSRYVDEAMKSHEEPAVVIFRKLETRLDNVVYRLGYAKTRQQARQLVVHGHVLVNEQRIDIPSYHVEPRNKISLTRQMMDHPLVKEQLLAKKPADLPSWLNREDGIGKALHYPSKDDLRKDIDFELIVEFYA